ncbi:hypothetical protein FAL54_24735 [Salmonella enterica subsp. enterica serovar Kentucky]|nr:hypothetical protein [Salmonella enterica subsp. enterica serovar Kentucky]EBL4486458.1 hypothetical protein [Salmonella enterica subsp. enterica serovar Kentucky]
MGSCAAPSAKGDDKFITTDYLQQCRLCFNNEDQLMFINRAFSRISPKAKGKDSLSLLFSVSYDFPGKADLINNHDFQELYLLFLNEDNL